MGASPSHSAPRFKKAVGASPSHSAPLPPPVSKKPWPKCAKWAGTRACHGLNRRCSCQLQGQRVSFPSRMPDSPLHRGASAREGPVRVPAGQLLCTLRQPLCRGPPAIPRSAAQALTHTHALLPRQRPKGGLRRGGKSGDWRWESGWEQMRAVTNRLQSGWSERPSSAEGRGGVPRPRQALCLPL